MQQQFKTFGFLLGVSVFACSLLSPTVFAEKAKYRHVLKFTYEQEPMYLCSVTNRSTGDVFYGKSPKKSFATMYARSYCQMMSYSGQCYIKATCTHEYVTVRKRNYVRQRVS